MPEHKGSLTFSVALGGVADSCSRRSLAGDADYKPGCRMIVRLQ